MRKFIILRIVLASLISGCAVTDQAPIEFRTSNNLTFELSKSRFDTIDMQPFETQLWLDSALVGSLMTMETSTDFETAVDEVRQGSNEAEHPSSWITISTQDDVFGEVLSSLSFSKTRE